MSPDEKNYQMDAQIGEANLRIKEILSEIMPDDWLEGELLVREADKNDDSLCTIDNAFINPHSTEQIHELPNALIEAISDLYVIFLQYQPSWKSCLITLTRTRTGGTMLNLKYSYTESC